MIKGEEIRKKRKALGMSAQALADLLKVGKDNIYKWEKGHRPNDPLEYQRLENWLSGKLEIVPHGTTNEPPSRNSLEKTLENMSEDKIRTTAIIERLVTLLEKQFQADGGGPRLAPQGTKGTIPIKEGQKKTSG